MLLYLSTNTCPNIAYAVSQVACFSTTPKKSHAQAVKHTICYLARTINKGTIFHPTTQYKLDCYVDADFMGLHGHEYQDNPMSAKSRTGSIINFGGCPLIWKSQLQTEVALSTFHAEYVTLSQALHKVLWIQCLFTEINSILALRIVVPTIHAEVFEDNNAALILATKQCISNRSCALNCKWHWFWQEVKDNKSITISKVSTMEQCADYLTKGLAHEPFEHIQSLNQGW